MERKFIQEVFAYLDSLIGPSDLFLIGGSSRDYLLNRDFDDFDFATSLSPEEMRKTKLNDVPKVDFSFAKYGTVNLKYQGYQITLASFRKESQYADSRHPKQIEFIKDPYVDSFRRDFTINAIYLNSSFEVFDPQKGMADLNDRVIRMIGKIPSRIEEDPLRIIRAYRFGLELNFKLEDELALYLSEHLDLIKKLNPEKVLREVKKIGTTDKQNELMNIINGKINPR